MAENKPDPDKENPEKSAEDFRVKMLECATPGMSVLAVLDLINCRLEKTLKVARENLGEVRKIIAPATKEILPLTDIRGGKESKNLAEMRMIYDSAMRLIFARLRERKKEDYGSSRWHELEDLMLNKIRWGRMDADLEFVPFGDEGEVGNITVMKDADMQKLGISTRYTGCQVYLEDNKIKPLIIVSPRLVSGFWAGFMMIRGLYYVNELCKDPVIYTQGALKTRLEITSLVERWMLVNDYAGPAFKQAFKRLFKKEGIVNQKDLLYFLAGPKCKKALNKIGGLITDEAPASPAEAEYRRSYYQYLLMMSYIAEKSSWPESGGFDDAQMRDLAALLDLMREGDHLTGKIYVGEK